MKKYIITSILFLLLISCNKTKQIVAYYPNNQIKIQYHINKDSLIVGNYEEFYENGNPKMVVIFDKGVKTDSSISLIARIYLIAQIYQRQDSAEMLSVPTMIRH